MITIYKVCFTAKCRKCGKEENFSFKPPTNLCETEAHEHLEGEGWVDNLCADCVKVEFSTKGDDDYNNSVENEL